MTLDVKELQGVVSWPCHLCREHLPEGRGFMLGWLNELGWLEREILLCPACTAGEMLKS